METYQTINLIENRKIAIVGGGPGGLTLARLLQTKGAKVKVYERDFSQAARVQGAIVDLHYDSGLKVIEAAGLLDAFKASYMPGADKYRLVDPKANILMDDGDKSSGVTFGNKNFRPEIDRGALRDMLLGALLPDTVVWDSQLVSMAQVDNCWELQFKNGSSATADVVIGADGYRSIIRPYLTDIIPLYSGATIIQGEIDHPKVNCPEMHQLVDNANLIAMGSGKTISIQPRGDGGLTFYAASMCPEHWIQTSGIDFNNAEEVCAYLVEFYDDWNPVFFSLFKSCSHFVARPLNYMPLEQKWDIKGNITLLGDAAHLMPPNGEGVNLAMQDALDLTECLTSTEFRDLQAAMVAYENIVVTRATNLLGEALEGIEDFASPSTESVEKLIEMLSGRES